MMYDEADILFMSESSFHSEYLRGKMPYYVFKKWIEIQNKKKRGLKK